MIHVIIHVPITLSNIGFNNKYNNPLPFQIILRYKPCFECAQNTYLTRLTQNVEHCYIHTIFYTFFTTVKLTYLYCSRLNPPLKSYFYLLLTTCHICRYQFFCDKFLARCASRGEDEREPMEPALRISFDNNPQHNGSIKNQKVGIQKKITIAV